MTIPLSINYPEAFDDDNNLFLVHDSLRVKLADDYIPGMTSIEIIDEDNIMFKFPPTGIITLTEQCSEPEERAVSLFYGSKTDSTFDDLELMPGFVDYAKPKNLTNIIMNVFSSHHNAIKDASIAIETFIGVKGTEDLVPQGTTLVGRLNYLRRLLLTPKAWFSANKKIGIVPVTVTFTNESIRHPTSEVWDFGDGTSSVSNISGISGISNDASDELTAIMESAPSCGSLDDLSDRTTLKTYYNPGRYKVKLTVGNKFGRDEVEIEDFFIARTIAPDEATISITPTKVSVNDIVNLSVTSNGEQSEDPINEYTWKLGDDLAHPSSPDAIAMYSVGGFYDAKLRVDTELGAYRITTIPDAINVVEQTNLYLMAFDTKASNLSITKSLRTYEFGLVSETFKSEIMPELSVTRNHNFIHSSYYLRAYQRSLFLRNVSFAPIGSVGSGDGGEGVLYWSEASNQIIYKKMNPFNETWSTSGLSIGDTETKNWNWMGFSTPDDIYILFGENTIQQTPTNVDQDRSQHKLDGSGATFDTYIGANYSNGAIELTTYADSVPATYRVSVFGENALFCRNDAEPGALYRLRNFYRTEGSLGDIATNIIKVPDIPGNVRTELELVSLSSGVYVFNNSGEVSAYSPETNTWQTGGPGFGSSAFRELQDNDVSEFSSTSQTLRATSDNDHRAYLSYDYSTNAFIKFNDVDLTFSSVGSRPTNGEQFMLSIF